MLIGDKAGTVTRTAAEGVDMVWDSVNDAPASTQAVVGFATPSARLLVPVTQFTCWPGLPSRAFFPGPAEGSWRQPIRATRRLTTSPSNLAAACAACG